MDGWELIWHIRQERAYDSIKAMIMSTTWVRGDASRCTELRIGEYLTKPVIMEELGDALAAVIAGCEDLGQQPAARHSLPGEQAHCSIMVADDVEINRELLRLTLEKRGHRVTMAVNGLDAVNKFRAAAFDLIFMDMQMPVLDGYAAVQQIREMEQKQAAHRTPIVAMTAYALQGDREKCLAADMDAYLAKPARPAEIIATLARLVPDKSIPVPQAVQIVRNTPASEPIAAQAAAPDSLPVFDRAELLARLGGREEMLGRFIAMFSKNVAGYMEALATAAEQGDVEQVRIQAHTIKGAAANISARRIRETASMVEVQAREAGLSKAAELVRQLAEELKAFQRHVSTDHGTELNTMENAHV
jgi:CheY-like chemotaxis protein/HPt (histidine-containing phosphotransfer) domain-containing protein